jgi:hypothetical protein
MPVCMLPYARENVMEDTKTVVKSENDEKGNARLSNDLEKNDESKQKEQ